MPPIYQPEVAVRGVVFAADHPRRKQYWVGASTVGTLDGHDPAPTGCSMTKLTTNPATVVLPPRPAALGRRGDRRGHGGGDLVAPPVKNWFPAVRTSYGALLLDR